MLQGSNGSVRLKLNLSKSKKRIIQAKNIQFKDDNPIVQKLSSLSPENQPSTFSQIQRVQANEKQQEKVLEDQRENQKEGQKLYKNENDSQVNFRRTRDQQGFLPQQLQQKLKKTQSEPGTLSVKTLGGTKASLKGINLENVKENLRLMKEANQLKVQREVQKAHAIENGAQNLINYNTPPINYKTEPQQPETMIVEQKHDLQRLSAKPQNPNQTPIIRNDYTPTTAASSNKRFNLQSADLMDPFSMKPLQPRKKVENRIDLELESRGSIFSGRDEAQILQQKRQLEQKDMQEALKKQIEEKKKRLNEEKQRQDLFESQWQSPKRSNVTSQGESEATSGLMSPLKQSKLSIQNQQPQTSLGQITSINQLVLQKYQSAKKLGEINLDVLEEEEKNGEPTGIQRKSLMFGSSMHKSPNTSSKIAVDQVQDVQTLPKSNSHSIIGAQSNKAQAFKVSNQIKHLSRGSYHSNQSKFLKRPEISIQKLNNLAGSQIPEKLEEAKIESQNQIDALSNMVEQLLIEQNTLKSKIIQQEKILETHLHPQNDDPISSERGSLSNRNSSREFKIRKQNSQSRQKLTIKRESESEPPLDRRQLEPNEEIINKNLILNHQLPQNNTKVDLGRYSQKEQQTQFTIQNSRYVNRQSNKFQFIERNEKIKQANHLLKYVPSNFKQARVQSLEPQRDEQLQDELRASQKKIDEIMLNNNNHDRIAVAKSIDALQKGAFKSERLVNMNKKFNYNSQSQENIKFSNSVKNSNNQNNLLSVPESKLGQSQNLDFAGQSQLLFYSENHYQKPTAGHFLPEIKKAQTINQLGKRNASLEQVKRNESESYREPVYSIYQNYETNVNASETVPRKSKQSRQRKDELDMISSIFMPESVVITSLEASQVKPTQILQNNLISSQRYIQQSEYGHNQNPFHSNVLQQTRLDQIVEVEQQNPANFINTKNQNRKKNTKKISNNKAHIMNPQISNQNSRIPQSTLAKFSQSNQQQQQINLAERLTFYNFKDANGPQINNNFEPIQMEQSQTLIFNSSIYNNNKNRQSPSPSNLNLINNQGDQLNRNSYVLSNPSFMVVKKSTNHRLTPISLIQKKITPVKKQFPHDFFTIQSGEGHFSEMAGSTFGGDHHYQRETSQQNYQND